MGFKLQSQRSLLRDLQGFWSRTKPHILHFLTLAIGRFREDLVSLRAMALTYTTLLSLVPFLAVTFSVLKAFGVQSQLEPFLNRTLEPLGPQGAEVTQRILGFVGNVRAGVLGAVGVAVLFYTVISLLSKVEDSLNHIWRARHSRSLGRKFSDYLSVVLVGPVLVFTAFALTASAQSYWLVQRILEIQPLGSLVVLSTRILPFVFLCAAFTFLYKFIPSTQVRLGSALVGGAVAGILWQMAGTVFATFVAASTRYAAVYSSFAILILFLLWLYIGWTIVLVGGEVAYLYQYPHPYLQGILHREQGHFFREKLALLALLEVTRRYCLGMPPWGLTDLAVKLGVPLPVLEEVFEGFIKRGLLLRVAEPEGIVLGRPPEQVAIVEVLDILRGPLLGGPVEQEEAAVLELLRRRDQAVCQALEGITLSSLASGLAGSPADLEACAVFQPV